MRLHSSGGCRFCVSTFVFLRNPAHTVIRGYLLPLCQLLRDLTLLPACPCTCTFSGTPTQVLSRRVCPLVDLDTEHRNGRPQPFAATGLELNIPEWWEIPPCSPPSPSYSFNPQPGLSLRPSSGEHIRAQCVGTVNVNDHLDLRSDSWCRGG